MVPADSMSLPAGLLATLRARSAGDASSAGRRAFVFLDSAGEETAALTFGELGRRVEALAAVLAARSAPGERALLLFPPGLDFVVAFLGCLRAGVVAVPAYPPRSGAGQARLSSIARDAGARFVLAGAAIVAAAPKLCAGIPELAAADWLALEDLPADGAAWDGPDPSHPAPGAPAFLQYTSGSTAEPKGVVVTHGNLAHNEEAIRLGFGQSESSVVVGWLPLYHDMGLIGNVLQPLYSGGTAVLFSPLAFLQRPRLWLEAIGRYRATTSGGPNFAYDLCVRKIAEPERAGLDLSSWSVAYNGAEPVRAETLDRFAAAFAPAGFRRTAFFPCYGLAEATLFVAGGVPGREPVVRTYSGEGLAYHQAVETAPGAAGARALVGCGRPSRGQRIEIVDPESAAVCPAGRIGEIWVAGPSVAAGYRGRDEDSARLFRARTAAGDGPFLRTGDLGMLAADGELFVTGRLKDLIILRGRNVYPQDIERTAEGVDPALRPGNGAAFSIERDGEERLVVVQEVEHAKAGAPDPATLAEAVRRAVADGHEVAVEEVVLLRSGTVPKTSSGKIRRQACREGYLTGKLLVVARTGPAAGRAEEAQEDEPAAQTGGVGSGAGGDLTGLAPEARRAEVARRLAAEAALALRLDRRRLERDLPLTALGLDSLAAVELRAAVEARTGVAPSLSGLLSGASLAALEDEVLAGLAEEWVAGPTPEPGAPLGEHPLSAGQEALWFVERLAHEAAAYNLAAAVRVEGDLDAAALGRALAALALRHPALRTTFTVREGEPRQVVHAEPAVDFRLEPAVEGPVAVPLAALAYAPFDLEHGPLLRVRLWPLTDGGWLLLLAVHHLVTDLGSLGILVRELGAVYGEETGRGPARLAPLPLGFTDFVRFQARALAGGREERLLAWWEGELGGDLPVLELPADRPRPAVQTYAALSRGLRLAPEVADRLRALARASGTTLFVTLLTGLEALLGRWTGQGELVIGTPTSGREAAFRGVMGYFVNPVALRLRAAGDPTWGELLANARAVAGAAFEHQDLPFARLAAHLQPERDAGRPPLFQALFAFQKAAGEGLAELALGEGGARVPLGELTLVSVPLAEGRTPVDLTLMAADGAAGLPVSLQVNRDLFDPATAERLLGHFSNLLAALAADPGARVAAAELLSPAERRQLAEWNRSDGEPPAGLCLPDLFAAQVARTPEREALVAGAERLIYGELAGRAGRLARRLAALGVGPEVRVGVSAGRSADLVVALLAVLEAGGAYVPLDPVQPAARLAAMLADSGATLLLAEERPAADLLAAGLPAGCRVVLLDSANEPAEALAERAARPLPENLAYLIYTSGSTGTPKGVAIEHRSAVAFLHWARQAFSNDELSGVLAATSIGFDVSVFEIFAPLVWGGRLILAENVFALPTLPAAGEVRVVSIVPSLCMELLRGASADGAAALPTAVTTVNLGGEPLPLAVARAVHAALPAARVLNLYGPSEDTTYSTVAVVPPGGERAPNIGRPIAHTRAQVLDREMRQVPIGVPGELCLGGAGLARGYFDRPDLTAERFVPDPLAAEPGGRCYRTGDLARRRADGELEYLGRFDHQVKIRGVRIELAEVEAVLLSRPGVREAAVLALGEASGDRRLVAFVVARAGHDLEASALRGALLALLPRAMVPAAIIPLPSLPLNANGKLDRRALARLAPAPVAGADGELAAPLTPGEELLAGIWAEALGVGRVGADDDFFTLGGHSLLALRVQARVRERLGADLPLADLFQFPTLAAQARRLSQGSQGSPGRVDARPPLVRAPAGQTVFPLSFAQVRLWLLERLNPGTAVYHMAGVADLEGPLDAGALGWALERVIERHDALRARFREVDGEPVQEIAAAGSTRSAGLPLVCLAGLEPERREAEAARICEGESRRPFDLTAEAPFRPLLVRLSSTSHQLLLTLHHIAADEDSLNVLARELAALYAAALSQRQPDLPALAVRSVDFAVWQREWLRGAALAERLAWWRERLADLPVVEMPADRPRREARGVNGALATAVPVPGLAEALAALARREGATLFMVLLAAFQVVLERSSGEAEVPVGSPVSSRDRDALLPLVGFLVNTLVLRSGGAAEETFAGRVRRVRGETIAAFEHGDLPLELLVEALRPERSLGRNPLFEVLFALQRPPRGRQIGELHFAPRTVPTGTAKFDLTLYGVEEEAGRLSFALEYATDLFDPPTARRLLARLENLLAAVAEDAARPLCEIPLLSPEERRQLVEWSLGGDLDPAALPVPASGASLADLFAAQAARTPEREALVAGTERLTYRELDQRVGRLARRLRALGVGPETRVGVSAGRSANLIAALLAVHRAGGAYVPLDPAQPMERLAWMLADSGAGALLAEGRLVPDFQAAGIPEGCRVLFLEAEEDGEAAAPGAGAAALPQNLAYLIYTSGSTGRPKGVAIEHRSAVTFVRWARQVFSDDELSGVLASTPIGFDLSVFEIFVPLATGGRVIMAENALALPGLPAVGEVRLVNTVPSLLAELMREENALPGSIAAINLAGEALPGALAEAVHRASPSVKLRNLYGPSETTTYSTFTVVPREGGQAPSIGRPIARTRVEILDRSSSPLPAGAPGELFLGGEGLARGYQGRPDLTAERFVPDPFEPGARLYRTGDRARRRADGELEYLGRLDHQVKIRGVRIEPGEVEAALLSRPGVREAAVLALGEAAGDRRLVAFVVVEAGQEGDAPALGAALLELLPRAMVPAAIVALPALPLTANGKLDRRALARLAPAPAPTAGPDGELAVPLSPAEELLAGIWAEALGVERVGAGDDFFALGGHSLLALRVQSRVRERLGADLPLTDLFQFPTLAAQARRLSRGAPGSPGSLDTRPPLSRAPAGQTVFPLSFVQGRLWLLERLNPGTAVYHMAGVADLEGPLDAGALGWALERVVERHEALRLRFREVDGSPVQEIAAAGSSRSVGLPLVCLAGLEAERREAEVARICESESRRPFDLKGEAPFRPLLVRLAPFSYQLLLTLHHIAADEESLNVLARELSALYAAALSPRPAWPDLPALALRPVDYAVWQREWLRGAALEGELGWWRERLADLPDVEMPADRPRREAREVEGAVATAVVAPAVAGSLAALGRRQGATLFMVLLAAFQTVLERVAGEAEVPVGCPVSSRDRDLLLPLVGFFVNTLVLRPGGAEATFAGRLRRLREVTVGAFEHADVPLELLAQALRPERAVGRNPLFEVVFALQRPPRGRQVGDLSFTPRIVPTGTAKFDFTLYAIDEEGRLSFALEYATGLFDAATARRLLGRLENLLAAVAEDAASPLAEFSLLSSAERRQLVEQGRAADLAAEAFRRAEAPAAAASSGPAPEAAPPAADIAMERAIAGIWRELLEIDSADSTDSIGADGNFFALGGHSLLLLPLQERLRERFGVSMQVLDLFKHPTVAGLARYLRGLQEEAGVVVAEGPAPILPRPAGAGDAPASFPQEQLWFLDRLEPGSPVYNLPTGVRLDGRVDRAALRRALALLVERQAILRTALGMRDGRAIQVVAERLVPALPEVDLSALPPAARDATAARLVAAEALLPFDLTAAPLFRAGLLRLHGELAWLLVNFHHTITDGWSLRIFFEDLAVFYRAEVAIPGAAGGDGGAGLPDLAVQYADFAVWQREWLRGERLEKLLAYWRQRLAGAPAVLELPFDRPRPEVQSSTGHSQPVEIAAGPGESLRRLARAESATLFTALLSAFATLLHRYTGETDVVLGTPTANRARPELEPLIGFFANTMALRLDLSGDPTFRQLLERLRGQVQDDYAHHEMPFEKLVDDLKPARDLRYNPIYQSVFALDTSARPDFLELPGLRLTPLPAAEGTSKFDLAFYMEDRGGRIRGVLEADRSLLDRSTAARWLGHFAGLVTAVVEDPDRRLSELPFLAPAEAEQLTAWIIDRRERRERQAEALAAPPALAEPAAAEPVADEALEKVAQIWRELIEADVEVGPRDNFFALGGRSLLLLPMQEKLLERFGVSLAIVDLFKYPTAEALARHLSALAAPAPAIPAAGASAAWAEKAAEPERPEPPRPVSGKDRFIEARRRAQAANRPARREG